MGIIPRNWKPDEVLRSLYRHLISFRDNPLSAYLSKSTLIGLKKFMPFFFFNRGFDCAQYHFSISLNQMDSIKHKN